MNKNTYIKFTGDFSKLKTMGFTFQRLYANNYMQWCNDDTRVWKKGSDVTIGHLTNFEGEFFAQYMELRPNLPWSKPGPFGGSYLRFIVDHKTGTGSFDYDSYIKETREDYREDRAPRLESIPMTERLLAPLEELIKLGWVELGVYDED